ncbi:MAG: sigma-70 family RNA polymerase sigma factor [Pyrinomonadaceae bacterium]|nr:sigma-70 family RNA polymerase sigma factor [Pyrinomonadaceae bacterium]
MKTENNNSMEQVISRPQITSAESESKIVAAQTDDLLVAAVLAGDDAAFADLFERYRRLVAHLVSRFFYRREEVEEFVQQSFTKIYFSLKDFRGEREKSLPAWLSKITVNLCYDELRRLKRRPENRFGDLSDEETLALERFAQSDAESAESNLIKRDLAEKLLSKLEASDRLAMTLFYGEDYSVQEVAELVGWTPSNVKTRLFRARNYLRKILQHL